MIVPATLASMAIHCVHAQIRCIVRLSLNTDPLVRTLAMLAIKPNASSNTERLEVSSNRYKMAVSIFSILINCLMGNSFFIDHSSSAREGRAQVTRSFWHRRREPSHVVADLWRGDVIDCKDRKETHAPGTTETCLRRFPDDEQREAPDGQLHRKRHRFWPPGVRVRGSAPRGAVR